MLGNRLGLRGRVTVTLFCLAIVSLLFGIVSYRLMVHLLEAELRSRLKNLAQLGALAIDADAFARLSAKAVPRRPVLKSNSHRTIALSRSSSTTSGMPSPL